MPFNRPPRIQTPLPAEVVEIPEPANLPNKPGASNWLTIVLSFGAIGLTIILFILISGGSSAGLGYLVFLPIMLVSYVATWFSARAARKKYDQDLVQARKDYGEALRSAEQHLQSLQRTQRQIMLDSNPDLGECVRRVGSQDQRVGERRPEDPDFLSPRIGVGTIRSSFSLVVADKKGRAPELQEEYKHADSLARTYSVVRDAPVVVNFPKVGSVGIAGPEREVRDAVRGLIAQVVVHHWPTEAEIAGTAWDLNLIDEWGWMRYLPHATTSLEWTSPRASEGKEILSKFMNSLEAILQAREESAAALHAATEDSAPPTFALPRILIIFDHLPATYNHSALSLLFLKGRELGVHGIFISNTVKDIPGGCGAIARFQDNEFKYAEVGPAGVTVACDRADSMSRAQADDLARKLGEIDLIQVSDLSRPPSRLGFMELLDFDRIEDVPVESWWDGASPYGYLRTPLGKTSDKAALIFDLGDKDGAHGPHGVIGGITGSGKSEVLKTMILGLAITHHPFDLNFALIDYKGGAAFNELSHLPHTVGVVTDIETHASYADRVILALGGEIEHRKKVLEDARAAFGLGRTHIDEYRKLAVKRVLPRLVIVFDEFAEFKQRHPEESKRLISIARLGRSLGIHLILATQNIQAAIDPEVLQNATFRICLRVSEPQDSMQMIGIRDAVALQRGRAYFMSQTRHLFQGAFSGGVYRSLGRGATRTATTAPEAYDASAERTEAQSITERLVNAAEDLHLRKPAPIWPDPLPERLYLPKFLQENVDGGWDGKNWRASRARGASASADSTVYPIIGLCDQPAQQRQSVLQIDPSRGEGHLLVFGSAKTGKSTMLRTFVSSLAQTRAPDEAWIYILDFGGQSALKVLEDFPHVGAVITRFESERAQRLIEFVHARIAERNELFRNASVDSWEDYNRKVKDKKQALPAIYLIIDGFATLRRTFMNTPNASEMIGSITSLVSGGLASGVHLVIASNLSADLPADLFSNINLRMTFHQADHRGYFEIVGQPSEARIREDISRPAVPGRGLLRGSPPLEFQILLPVSGETDNDQYLNLAQLGEKMKKAWEARRGASPVPIRSLPLLITLPHAEGKASTPAGTRARLYVPLGKDYENLAETGFSLDEDGPTFLVAGAGPRSGKTTLVITWLIGLAERYTRKEVQLVILDFHSRSLAALKRSPLILTYVGIKSELEPALDQIDKELRKRADQREKAYEKDPDNFSAAAFLESLTQIVVVIDSYEAFSQKISDNERNKLANCLVQGEDLGIAFIVAGDLAKLPSEYGSLGPSLLPRIKQQGCGILLGGSEGADQFNNARIPMFQRAANLPPGRGYVIQKGQAKMFQAYAYWQENEEPLSALQKRIGK